MTALTKDPWEYLRVASQDLPLEAVQDGLAYWAGYTAYDVWDDGELDEVRLDGWEDVDTACTFAHGLPHLRRPPRLTCCDRRLALRAR